MAETVYRNDTILDGVIIREKEIEKSKDVILTLYSQKTYINIVVRKNDAEVLKNIAVHDKVRIEAYIEASYKINDGRKRFKPNFVLRRISKIPTETEYIFKQGHKVYVNNREPRIYLAGNLLRISQYKDKTDGVVYVHTIAVMYKDAAGKARMDNMTCYSKKRIYEIAENTSVYVVCSLDSSTTVVKDEKKEHETKLILERIERQE